MEKMNNQLLNAISLWSGWKKEMHPIRSDAKVIKHYGQNKANELLSQIHLLEDDYYSSDARLIADDLAEMSNISIEHFRQKHPHLDAEIGQIFSWCYTYDYK